MLIDFHLGFERRRGGLVYVVALGPLGFETEKLVRFEGRIRLLQLLAQLILL